MSRQRLLLLLLSPIASGLPLAQLHASIQPMIYKMPLAQLHASIQPVISKMPLVSAASSSLERIQNMCSSEYMLQIHERNKMGEPGDNFICVILSGVALFAGLSSEKLA